MMMMMIMVMFGFLVSGTQFQPPEPPEPSTHLVFVLFLSSAAVGHRRSTQTQVLTEPGPKLLFILLTLLLWSSVPENIPSPPAAAEPEPEHPAAALTLCFSCLLPKLQQRWCCWWWWLLLLLPLLLKQKIRTLLCAKVPMRGLHLSSGCNWTKQQIVCQSQLNGSVRFCLGFFHSWLN